MNAEEWPVLECTQCRKACVIRLCYRLDEGVAQYLWQRDCKCKRGSMAERADATALGPVQQAKGD